ncbi:MAG: phosphatidylserine decarboxylase family protein [Kiritimatiellae bacterium]|nr:phosphatidylserine decarboxylase family protein [Kiritimatiellia bacterium]
MIRIVKDGWLWTAGALLAGGVGGWLCGIAGWRTIATVVYAGGVILAAFMLYFHRDPSRVPPPGEGNILAGADGLIRRVDRLTEDRFLKTEAVRISIFLSPFNVHVNRAPLGGTVTGLDYTPGRHLLTICNSASEMNEHSSILIEGQGIRCLVKQIVGPIVRRVVYWLETGQAVGRGQSIGMMKFGSRLDIYLPAAAVEVLVKKGDKVYAGRTVVARIMEGQRA